MKLHEHTEARIAPLEIFHASSVPGLGKGTRIWIPGESMEGHVRLNFLPFVARHNGFRINLRVRLQMNLSMFPHYPCW